MIPKCTEHALFRYCQRILGADVKWLSEQLSAQVGDVTKDGDYKLKDYDAYAIVKNGFVITILTAKQLRDVQKAQLKKKPRRIRNRFRFEEASEGTVDDE